MEEAPRQHRPHPIYKPLSRVPERRSSRSHMTATPLPEAPAPSSYSSPRPGKTVPSRGRSCSPIRRSESQRARAASRTYAPTVLPADLLNTPILVHPRICIDIRLSSPIFMGGATIEGEVVITIDGGLPSARRKAPPILSISRVSASVVGIERCKSKQDIFCALTTDLIDNAHPPPLSMAPIPVSDGSWEVRGSVSLMAFRLDLPVDMGPPPYKGKKVGINYLLSILVEAQIAEKKHLVRQSRDIMVLTVHDPERALVNLSSPLLVSDELHFSKRSNIPKIGLMAGLHRQTWISGYLIFVDVHIENNSSKTVKKIELQLEKVIALHNYSAPSTNKGRADILRLPDHMSKEIIARAEVLDGFHGVQAGARDLRTCQMELPTGLVSIETGRFFGIRYFLNVQICCSFGKRLKVQLPITIIHPNSIDIPPNALAQVTASIEHKHRNLSSGSGTGLPYRYRPGQAFAAARRQSYLKLREDTIGSAEMDYLTRALEGSPRKSTNARHPNESPTKKTTRQIEASPKRMKIMRRQSAAVMGSSSQATSNNLLAKQRASFDNGFKYKFPPSSFDTIRAMTGPVTEPRVSFDDKAVRGSQPRSSLETKVLKGLRSRSSLETNSGPRLQRSTSGLGFDESDKENQNSGEMF